MFTGKTLSRLQEPLTATTAFTSTLAGKLVLFMLVPLLVVIALGLTVWLFVRRRRHQLALKASRDAHRGSRCKHAEDTWAVIPSEFSEKGTSNTDYASCAYRRLITVFGRWTFSRRGRLTVLPYGTEGAPAGCLIACAVTEIWKTAKARCLSATSRPRVSLSDRWDRNSATTRTDSPVSPATEGSPRSHALSP